MEAFAYVFKVAIPDYLQNVPIPTSLSGFADLAWVDWISLFLFLHILLLIIVALVKLFLPKVPTQINANVKKDDPKVVDLVDVEDLDKEKVSYCRCWKSKTFPLCDATHNEHNKETGDNLGPLVVRYKNKSKAK